MARGSMSFDLAIIGGGPAGTAASITAARSGARVLLLERGRFPRHKVCGEFISPEGLALLAGLGLDDLVRRARRIAHARIFAETSVAEAVLSPAAASISRYELDHALWRLAADAGADCRQQVEARAIMGTGPFDLSTSVGEFSARAVVNASGRWSNLRRSRLARSQREKWVGWKAHFREADSAMSVDLYFFPGGYCGVQPLGNGQVNACAMVRAAAADSMDEVLALHPRLAERSRAWQQVSETVATSPLVFAPPQAEESGVLFAGDAAGFIDPFVGDGISLALHSGMMAAQALAGKRSVAEAAAIYRRRYERELRPLFRNAEWLRRLTSIPRVLHRPVMAVLQSPRVTRFLVGKTRRVG
ncbi:MAG TPA: FAD-dependent oxidoreductase [Terriglobales bacterium]|nr:FAD-dependent oxidoreductase [Terriglobales bacterium]